MAQRKVKLLKKYLGEVKVKKENSAREGFTFKDQEEIDLNSSLSSDSESEEVRGRRRVDDSDEEEIKVKPKDKKGEQVQKKSKTVTKGLRKVLGLEKGEDVDEFVSALKVEGVDMKVIEEYLKKSKEGLKMENKKEKKLKKKKQKEKKRIRDSSPEEKEESEGSDLMIPEQSRTIYRDKQGRIKEFSAAKEKQMKEQQVLDRLGEWQKGLKNNEDAKQSEEDVRGVWDDPARRWQSTLNHPLSCQFQGYANRFNIKPGFRWDGVIRGNNFQTKCLQEVNLKKAKESQEQRQYLKNL